jgi:hypothetical protein
MLLPKAFNINVTLSDVSNMGRSPQSTRVIAMQNLKVQGQSRRFQMQCTQVKRDGSLDRLQASAKILQLLSIDDLP